MRPRARAADVVAGAADALQPARDRARRLDLQHEIDRAHVDAELERRRRGDRAQPAGLERFLDLLALMARDRAVVRAHELDAGLGEPRSTASSVSCCADALGEPPRVDEHDRRAVREDQRRAGAGR